MPVDAGSTDHRAGPGSKWRVAIKGAMEAGTVVQVFKARALSDKVLTGAGLEMQESFKGPSPTKGQKRVPALAYCFLSVSCLRACFVGFFCRRKPALYFAGRRKEGRAEERGKGGWSHGGNRGWIAWQ